MTAKIDLAVMQVLQKLLSTAEIGQIPSAPGIYFFFDKPGRLLYIGATTGSLLERVRAHVAGKGVSNTKKFHKEICAVGYIEVHGLKKELDMLRTMLVNGYFPKYNKQDVKRGNEYDIYTVHGRVLGDTGVDKKKVSKRKTVLKPTLKEIEIRQENSDITYARVANMNAEDRVKKLWSCQEAGAQLHLPESKVLAISDRLLKEQYTFQRDMKKNMMFTMRDLVVIQVLLNLNPTHDLKKQEIKEAISLVRKFGIEEALRISEKLLKT
ncbi:GIY-YIG nuclease family protein [Priestia megaterium]